MNSLTIDTPIGRLTIIEKGGFITNIFFENESKSNAWGVTSPVLEKAKTQLSEYFNGKRKVFDIPLKPKGTEFMQNVWQIMIEKVQFGQTAYYSQIAEMVGSPKSCRAVGMANNRNPIPIIIPCHRIIGKGGSLVGFRGGLDMKKFLLTFESK